MAIPPFGSAPTPLATQTRAGKVTLAQFSAPVPTRVASGTTFEIPVDVQILTKASVKVEAGGILKITGTLVQV